MEIVAISETPNHNTMKISLSEPRQDNSSTTYTSAKKGNQNLLIDYSISMASNLFLCDGLHLS